MFLSAHIGRPIQLYDILFVICAAKAASGYSTVTYQTEKTGATIHQGQKSGAEIERNWEKRKISAVTAWKLVGGRHETIMNAWCGSLREIKFWWGNGEGK